MCVQSLGRVEVGCGEVLRAEGCSTRGEKEGKGRDGGMVVEKFSEAHMPSHYPARLPH